MVIPQIILPAAGTAPTAQPGTSAAGTDTVSTEGLFAELLASLQGFVEGSGVDTGNPQTGDGENALPLNGETIASAEGEEASAPTVTANLVVAADVASEAATAIAGSSSAIVAEENVTPQLQRAVPLVAESAAKVAPETALSPAPGNPAPRPGANVALANGSAIQPVTQTAPDVPVSSTPPAPAEAKVTLPPQAATPTPPAAEPALRTAPGLTDAKPPSATVPVEAGKPVEVPDVSAKPATPGEAPPRPDLKVPVTETVRQAKAESKPEGSEPLVIEKAKPFADALRKSDEQLAQPLRKAVEAFSKPTVAQNESAASVPRPQPPAIAPVVSGESTVTPVADVTRVTAAIAPAEIGAEAPKPAVAAATTEAPARSTLPELAETALRGIRYLARNGEHRMTVRLIPETLGQVHIEVLSSKEALSVKLVADSAVARDVMESHIHQLRDSLSQEGLEVRSITISDEPGSGRGALYQRDANASRNSERGQSQSNNQTPSDQSSGRQDRYAAPRARHEGAFDRVA